MTEIQQLRHRAIVLREAAEIVSTSLGVTGNGKPRTALDGSRVVSGICSGTSCSPHCHGHDRQRLWALAEQADREADELWR